MAKKRGKKDRSAMSFELGEFQPPSGYKGGSNHHGRQKSFTSTREAYHRGRKIKIKTTYRIEIDDEPLTLHTMVMDDGSVHCHGLPNYSFPSAVDLAKSIVDASRLAHYDQDELAIDPNSDEHGETHR